MTVLPPQSRPDALVNYFRALARHYGPLVAETTEHSGRTALENLLNALKPAGVTVVQEPGRQGVFGAPDFKITHNGRILGYIETKPPGENLSKILRSPQLKRYLELTDNLVLTDYYRFIWLRRGKPIKDVRIGEPEDARAAAR